MMLVYIFLVLLHCGSSESVTTSTQSVPPTLETNHFSLCNLTNPCLNGGTCHELNLDEEVECSSDPGMGEAVCHCPKGYNGSRCEIQKEGMCGGRICTNNERCVLVDYRNNIYKCVDDQDTSDLTAPHCLPGVHHVNYTLNLKDRDTYVACLDMYYTSNTSYCHDIDSSLDFEIKKEDVSNLFCLKIDYTEWQTCIAINKTFNKDNFPDKSELDVTLSASENDRMARSASITFRVVFNTAPSVIVTSKSYVVNMGTENNPFAIDLAGDFAVWDEQQVYYSLEVEDARLSLSSSDGSLQVQLRDREAIVARVKITDDGIPKLSTTITVIIEVFTLNCEETRSKFYVELGGQEETAVGQIECVKSTSFSLTHTLQTSTRSGRSTSIDVRIDSNGFVRVTPSSPGTYAIDVTVNLEGKLSVQLPRIDVIVGAINTCAFLLTNQGFRTEYENIKSKEAIALSSNIEAQIQSLPRVDGEVDVLFFREGNPGRVEVYFLLITDSKSEENVVDSAIAAAVQTGSLGNLTVDSRSYQCYDKVGLAQVTRAIEYWSSDSGNSPSSTKNDTYVELTCQGFFILPVGEVTVEWRMTSKNATVVPLSFSRLQTSQNSPATDLYVGTLTASNILYKDSGPFTCIITDNAGNHASTSLDVRVIAPPVVSLLPMGQAFIESSETLTLTCKVVEPLETDTIITWFRDDAVVESDVASSSQYDIEGSSLKSAVYFCRGENLAGQGSRSSKVLVVITSATRCRQEGLWPGATVGTRVEAPCSDGMSGIQTRTCGNDGTWMGANTTQCVSDDITDVITDIQWILDGVQVGSLSSLTESLATRTPPDTLESREIELVSQSLETLLNISASNISLDMDETVNFTQSFMVTASNLLDPRTADTWKTIQERPTRILDSIDSVGELAANSLRHGQKQYLQSDNIDIEVGKTNLLMPEDIEFPTKARRDENVTLNSFLFLPAIAVERSAVTGPTPYTSVYYKHLTDHLPNGQQTRTTDNSSLIVNSKTLALTFFSSPNITLDPPLTINFTHENNLINDENPLCVYLNTKTNAWESDGCNTTETNQLYTVCVCSHLTNFAILMNPTNQVVTHLAIQIITYIGCSISIFCLVLTVIIYVTVWRYVKNDQAILLMNTCVCLGVSMMLFLIGIDKTSNEAACKAIAVLLHLFYLATFFSMLACGLEILWTLVQVFAARSKIKPLLIGSWILPLVIVAVSMGATSLEGYGTKTACWLSTENSLIYAFIAPVLLIIVINFILIGKFVYTLLNVRAIEDKTIQTKIKKGLRGICILVPVLGVSWVIGIFAFNEETVVFQYIFAVLNSLQGLFIFITQVVLSKKIKKGLVRYKKRYSSSGLAAKPADAQSPRAGAIGLDQIQNRDPASSAYANLLEPASETSGYLRPDPLGDLPSDPYDLPEDVMTRGSNPYSGLDDNQRVSNVYNEIGADQRLHGQDTPYEWGERGSSDSHKRQRYEERSDPTYKNVEVHGRPKEDGNGTNDPYYNISGREDIGTRPRLEPVGASATLAVPPLPRRREAVPQKDFITHGSKTDARAESENPPPLLFPRPRLK